MLQILEGSLGTQFISILFLGRAYQPKHAYTQIKLLRQT